MLSGIALATTLLAPVAASAAEGFATANVNMRSGPSTRYPAVVVIPVGAPVEIHGCLADANWCDVSFSRGRGWVSGSYVQAEYQRSRVYVAPRYYRPLGIPTVTFELGNYWDRNYRNRDFYRDREYWRGGPDRFERDRDRPRFDRDRDRDRARFERDRDRDRFERDRDRDRFNNDGPRFDRDRPDFERDRNRDRDGNRDRPRFDRDNDGNRDRPQFDRDRRDNDRRDNDRQNFDRRDNGDRRDNDNRRDNDRNNPDRGVLERPNLDGGNDNRRDRDRDRRGACEIGEPGCTL
ncbi:SH3 domain-containing protein [Rhizobium sp. DKSPLA3]|uniref:SH3 domain-containing protein n=1 Tax=Rhizobium quercicola TaxID=2901226 RepID=A0A9X1T8R4_9HYPH|nr:SH3 domain-containing protein [Rhizobium quercicola]